MSSELTELFQNDAVDKQYTISYGDGVIENDRICGESMDITENLCSEEYLRFGCCEAGTFKIRIVNEVIPLIGKKLNVSVTLKGESNFQLGCYIVDSDKPTADRQYRDVVAYDAMYEIISANVADWYNTILPDADSTVNLKEFRTGFIEYFGLEQEEVSLINDGMVVERTIEPAEISGKDVIEAVCELNGCFGHIGRDGKFHYVFLPKYIQGLYPAEDLYPSEDLYPAEPNSERIDKSHYISCQYEDFITGGITKLQIRQEENDIGAIVGDGDNCYIVEDNFLVYGKSAEDLETIAQNLLGVIENVTYRPFSADAKGNPCLEVGDAVRLNTKYEIVESYILERCLKGVQALRDTYSAEGVETYDEDVNDIRKSIIQLKGKTNTLERTVEETKSTITDVEKGLQSRITQTAAEIKLETSRTLESYATTEKMNAAIEVSATDITQKVSATYQTKDDMGNYSTTMEMNSAIDQKANSILLKVGEKYVDGTTYQSYIEQTAREIESKVSEGDVCSVINQSADSIHFAADRLSWESTYSSMEEDGTFRTSEAYITGGGIEIGGAALEEVKVAVRYKDNYATEMSASAFVLHALFGVNPMEYANINTAASWLYAPLTLGTGGGQRDYQLYVASNTLNSKIANTLELDNSPVVGSDRNLKEDIRYMTDEECIENILNLQQAEFVYKSQPDILHHGIIAQDAEENFAKGWTPVRQAGQYKAVAYEEIIGDLIGAVKYLHGRVQELERKLGTEED